MAHSKLNTSLLWTVHLLWHMEFLHTLSGFTVGLVHTVSVLGSWQLIGKHLMYSVSQKNPPRFCDIFFPNGCWIFSQNFTHLLHVHFYAGLHFLIQLSTILTKLCHIKCGHPVHTICSKCPPSAEMYANIWTFSDIFSKQLGIFLFKLYTPIIRSYLC